MAIVEQKLEEENINNNAGISADCSNIARRVKSGTSHKLCLVLLVSTARQLCQAVYTVTLPLLASSLQSLASCIRTSCSLMYCWWKGVSDSPSTLTDMFTLMCPETSGPFSVLLSEEDKTNKQTNNNIYFSQTTELLPGLYGFNC
jgi:hypothetical protein